MLVKLEKSPFNEGAPYNPQRPTVRKIWYSPFFSAKAMASSLVEKDSNMLDKGSPLREEGGQREEAVKRTKFLFFYSNYFSFGKSLKSVKPFHKPCDKTRSPV